MKLKKKEMFELNNYNCLDSLIFKISLELAEMGEGYEVPPEVGMEKRVDKEILIYKIDFDVLFDVYMERIIANLDELKKKNIMSYNFWNNYENVIEIKVNISKNRKYWEKFQDYKDRIGNFSLKKTISLLDSLPDYRYVEIEWVN